VVQGWFSIELDQVGECQELKFNSLSSPKTCNGYLGLDIFLFLASLIVLSSCEKEPEELQLATVHVWLDEDTFDTLSLISPSEYVEIRFSENHDYESFYISNYSNQPTVCGEGYFKRKIGGTGGVVESLSYDLRYQNQNLEWVVFQQGVMNLAVDSCTWIQIEF